MAGNDIQKDIRTKEETDLAKQNPDVDPAPADTKTKVTTAGTHQANILDTIRRQAPDRQSARDYAVIKLPAKLRAWDPPFVTARVNGERVRLKRKCYVPIKKKFIEALRHAVEPVVEREDEFDSPNVNTAIIRRRKVTDFSPRFPFELIGYVNKEVYQHLRSIALKRELTEAEVMELV